MGNSGCHRLSPGHGQCGLSQALPVQAEGKPCRDREGKAWDETQPNPREPEQPLIAPRAVHGGSVAQLWLRAGWRAALLIWHFLSLQSNHTGLSLSSLNPLQTLAHNDPL